MGDIFPGRFGYDILEVRIFLRFFGLLELLANSLSTLGMILMVVVTQWVQGVLKRPG